MAGERATTRWGRAAGAGAGVVVVGVGAGGGMTLTAGAGASSAAATDNSTMNASTIRAMVNARAGRTGGRVGMAADGTGGRGDGASTPVRARARGVAGEASVAGVAGAAGAGAATAGGHATLAAMSIVLVKPGEGRGFFWGQDFWRYTVTGEQTGVDGRGGYTLAAGVIRAGGGPPPCVHEREEFGLLVVDGVVEFLAGNHAVSLSAGAFVNVGRGVVRSYVNPRDQAARVVYVFAPAGVERWHEQAGVPATEPGKRPDEPASAFAARLKTTGPAFGVDADPPAAAFAREPRMTIVPPGAGPAYGLLGDIYVIKAAGEDTGGAYALMEAMIPPGGGSMPRVHQRGGVGYMPLTGAITLHYQPGPGQKAVQQDVPAGTFAHVPAGVAHAYRNQGQAGMRMLMISAPSGLERLTMDLGREIADARQPVPAPTPEDVARVRGRSGAYGIVYVG